MLDFRKQLSFISWNIGLLWIILMCLQSNGLSAQNKQQAKIYYNLSQTELLRNTLLTGSASYSNSQSFEVGIHYLRITHNKWRWESGISFLSAQVDIEPAFAGTPVVSTQESLKLVSIPVYLNYSLSKRWYAYGGPLLSIQLGERSFDNQTGLAYCLGIGFSHSVNDWSLFLSPNIKRHAAIPFQKENHHQKLTQIGIQIGVAYHW